MFKAKARDPSLTHAYAHAALWMTDPLFFYSVIQSGGVGGSSLHNSVIQSGGSGKECASEESADEWILYNNDSLFIDNFLPSTMPHTSWVYIITNKNNTTLYVGMTTAIATRMWEHRTMQNPGSFSARYKLNKLVYYEGFDTILEAVAREKFIKGKSRKWKIDLVGSFNPEWKDLTEVVKSL